MSAFGEAGIQDIQLKPGELTVEDDSELHDFLKDALCMNLQAIKDDRSLTEQDYRTFLIKHAFDVSDKHKELEEHMEALSELAREIHDGKLSDAAFDVAVLTYCR